MGKDRFWFEHDSNSHDDPKMLELRMQFGWSAYGAFWAIAEMLRDADGYTIELNRLGAICFNLRIERDWVDAMFDIGLLVRDDDCFWSTTLLDRMAKWDEKKARRAAAGRKGGIAKGRNSKINSIAKAKQKQKQTQSKANAEQSNGIAQARTEQNRTEQERETSISKFVNKTDKTSKVEFENDQYNFLPLEKDRQLARDIVDKWPECTPVDAVAWVQQAKQSYLLQLKHDQIAWLNDVALIRSPNDPVYNVNGQNKLHQWLMNCLKNTIRDQSKQTDVTDAGAAKAARAYEKTKQFVDEQKVNRGSPQEVSELLKGYTGFKPKGSEDVEESANNESRPFRD
jgi:hypothetical protein